MQRLLTSIMEILLFGITKDIVGRPILTIPESEQLTTVAELKKWLSAEYAAIGKLSSLAVAVDSEYADDNMVIDSRSEVALIPPVSGG